MQKIFDLVIAGAGPAGLTAGLYGGSRGLKVALIESGEVGGRAGTSPRIENCPGFPDGISGAELGSRLCAQARKFHAEIFYARATSIIHADARRGLLLLGGVEAEVWGRALLLTTGLAPRTFEVPGLAPFVGKSVFFEPPSVHERYEDMEVAVMGGGNAAAQTALFLAHVAGARHVNLIVPEASLYGMARYLCERITGAANISLFLGASLTRARGVGEISSLTLRRLDGVEREVSAKRLFAIIGGEPYGAVHKDVACDTRGYVTTGVAGARPFETSITGVFAAGDIRSGSVKCIPCAFGEAVAALEDVHAFLKSRS